MNFLFGKLGPTVSLDEYKKLEKQYNDLHNLVGKLSVENHRLKEYEENINKIKENEKNRSRLN